MFWPIIISLALGAVCASRMAVLPFAIIAFLAAVGVAFMASAPGSSAAHTAFFAFIVVVFLEAGYVIGIVSRPALAAMIGFGAKPAATTELKSHLPPE